MVSGGSKDRRKKEREEKKRRGREGKQNTERKNIKNTDYFPIFQHTFRSLRFFFFLNLFLFFFQAFHPLFSLLPDPDIAMRKEGLSKDRENSRQRAHPSRFTKPGSHQLAQTTIFSPVVKFLFDYSLVTAITSFSQNIYVRELIRK